MGNFPAEAPGNHLGLLEQADLNRLILGEMCPTDQELTV